MKQKFASAKTLSEVNPADYDAIFYVGGHGPVIDLASDATNAKLASAFFQAGKITSAVCHGPAALVGAVDANGKSIFDGRKATGFSNEEEIQAKGTEIVPFLLEDRIKSLGGKFEAADQPWGVSAFCAVVVCLTDAHACLQVKVVVDGNLITGQNPASAGPIGKAILEALQK